MKEWSDPARWACTSRKETTAGGSWRYCSPTTPTIDCSRLDRLQAPGLDARWTRRGECQGALDPAMFAAPGEIAREAAGRLDRRGRLAVASLGFQRGELARPRIGVTIEQEIHGEQVLARGDVACLVHRAGGPIGGLEVRAGL